MENAAHYLDVLMERDYLLTFLPRAKLTTLHGSHTMFTLWIKHFLRAKMEPISQFSCLVSHNQLSEQTGINFTCFQMEQHLLIHRAVVHREATQTAVIIAEPFLRFHKRAIISSAIMNAILRSFSVNYGHVY